MPELEMVELDETETEVVSGGQLGILRDVFQFVGSLFGSSGSMGPNPNPGPGPGLHNPPPNPNPGPGPGLHNPPPNPNPGPSPI
jgi:hypothetical protein